MQAAKLKKTLKSTMMKRIDQMYLFNEHNRLSMAVGQPVGYLQGDDNNYNSFWEMQEVIVDHIVRSYYQKRGKLKDLKLVKNEFREEFLKFLTVISLQGKRR
jgi:hypothetical protein